MPLRSGISTFCFSGAAEDTSAVNQNPNYKMTFSKFVAGKMDFTRMKMNPVTNHNFNTESTKVYSNAEIGDLLVASLRNYVANQEVTIRESKLNSNNYFYNPDILQNTSERIFWKWLRKTGIIEFEPALPNDEYVDGSDLAVDDTLPDDYFKEYIWKERSQIQYSVNSIVENSNDTTTYLVSLNSSSNIKPGDFIILTNQSPINIGFLGTKYFVVTQITTSTQPGAKNDVVIISKKPVEVDLNGNPLIFPNPIFVPDDLVINQTSNTPTTLMLYYERVIKYIGEVAGINSIQKANSSYTQVATFIPDQNGETPDILFRIKADANYSPGLFYPILPSQDQPEIIGSENYNSPLVSQPQNYPGDQYGFFDSEQKYQNSAGYQDRRRGDYYGITVADRTTARIINTPYVYPEFDGSNLDGITMDFNIDHFSKMNLPNNRSTNFDEFSAKVFNNLPPKDFDFNFILWYYEVEDLTKTPTVTTIDSTTTTVTTADSTESITLTTQTNTTPINPNGTNYNLYAISILSDVDPTTFNLPVVSKLVTNGTQDGTAYEYGLDLNFSISSDNPTEPFDPSKTYQLFGMDLYNELMKQMIISNDSFSQGLGVMTTLATEVNTIKQLIYGQTDIRDINSKIQALYTLLNAYKSLQIKDSPSIVVQLDESTTPPSILLNSIDPRYGDIKKLPVTTLYNAQTNLVQDIQIVIPQGKDMLVSIINDDQTSTTLDRNLNVVISGDLAFKQSIQFYIYPENANTFKNINISINTALVTGIDPQKGYQLISNLILPVDQNLNTNLAVEGIQKRWANITYPQILALSVSIQKISNAYYLRVEVDAFMVKAFKTGDVIMLENLLVKGVQNTDLSGQYVIVGDITDNKINVLLNTALVTSLYETDLSTTSPTLVDRPIPDAYLLQPPLIKVHKGYKINITCIDRTTTTISDKYLIQIENFQKYEL
jgi:hypothetical protein